MVKIKISIQGKLVCLFWAVLILCVCTGCPVENGLEVKGYRVYAQNGSESKIWVYLNENKHAGATYPDSVLPKSYFNYRASTLAPGEHYSMGTSYNGLGDSYDKFSGDPVCLFIVSVDTVNKYGWDDVKANYRILKRYDITRKDIVLLDGIFPYPPTPKMSQMKMYPPYGE